MNIWTIYDKPIDYPQKFVARRFEVVRGSVNITSDLYICDTLEEARSKLPYGVDCIPRDPSDEPHIVESWI
jgi:hypothetical protein